MNYNSISEWQVPLHLCTEIAHTNAHAILYFRPPSTLRAVSPLTLRKRPPAPPRTVLSSWCTVRTAVGSAHAPPSECDGGSTRRSQYPGNRPYRGGLCAPANLAPPRPRMAGRHFRRPTSKAAGELRGHGAAPHARKSARSGFRRPGPLFASRGWCQMDLKECSPRPAAPQNVHRRAEERAPGFSASSSILRFRLCTFRTQQREGVGGVRGRIRSVRP